MFSIEAKYKKKAFGCINGLCLHMGAIVGNANGKIQSTKMSCKERRTKSTPADISSLQQATQQQQCPTAFALSFLASAADADAADGPIDGKALNKELEECIRQGQIAIGQLELLKARQNAIEEIQKAFEEAAEEKKQKDECHENEENEENEGKEEINEEKPKESGSKQFLQKFVHQLRGQYEVAKQIEKIVPSLLEELCSGSLPEEEKLSSERLLSRNFAKLLDMAIRFDTLKTATPTLQNGFSLYRRMNLIKNYGSVSKAQLMYAHLGDQIALFLSRQSPMLASIVNGTERFIGRQQNRELAISHSTEALLVIYNVLRHTLERRKQLNMLKEQNGGAGCCPAVGEFLLRAMIGVLLLFDHIQIGPQAGGGIFGCSSNSPFDIVEFVAIVKRSATVEKAHQLLCTLRFMSRHFNDAQTPGHVRRMFN